MNTTYAAASDRAASIANRVERFVRDTVIPYERDLRCGPHGPSEDLVHEMRLKARAAGVLTPHIPADGTHLSQREMALVFRACGLSPLGPVATNTMAPDEGNMLLLSKIASARQKTEYLSKLVAGEIRSTFLMSEPADDQGAGSDPGLLKTSAVREGNRWRIDGRKTFATGAAGASFAILMARTGTAEQVAATMFLVPLPNPAVRIVRILNTLDSSMPGGHAEIAIDGLELDDASVLGGVGEGFTAAQVRLSPARLSHCMRWLGSVTRAHEIATDYAIRRRAFGKLLIDHEGVGFMLADNAIEIQQAQLMIDWCAGVLDSGSMATTQSSMTKAAVSESLFRIADRCVQIMGGSGLTRDSVVEQIFRETRSFRVYDGPTEVHKWSIARKIKRDALAAINA